MGLTTSIPSWPSKNSDRPTDGTRSGAAANRGSDAPDSLIGAVESLTEQLLWPAAVEVDRAGRIPDGHFTALARLGLYGMVVRPEQGGLGLAPGAVRRVLRILGSGCGATGFAFAQHHGTVASVASSGNRELRDRWLPELVDDGLAGIAYAHVRRAGPPVLTAEPDGDGWIFNGTAPWVTSWGTAVVLAVAAATDDGRLVWALVPARPAGGLSVAGTFDLMVFGATATVALAFDRFRVGPEAVIEVVETARWSRRDRFLAARPNPLCLGVGDRAMSLLAAAAPEMAEQWWRWWEGVGDAAEGQARAVDDGTAELREVAAARAETLMAVQRITTALLAASGGGAIETSHPAQRLSREALFYVIQAQSGDGRRAMLERLTPTAGCG